MNGLHWTQVVAWLILLIGFLVIVRGATHEENTAARAAYRAFLFVLMIGIGLPLLFVAIQGGFAP